MNYKNTIVQSHAKNIHQERLRCIETVKYNSLIPCLPALHPPQVSVSFISLMPWLLLTSCKCYHLERTAFYLGYVHVSVLSHPVVSHSLRPMNCSPPGSSVHGISQVRILEWVVITPGGLPDPGTEPLPPASPASAGIITPGGLPDPGTEPLPPASPASAGRFFTPEPLLLLLLSRFSRVQLCATPQTAALQAPQSLGFSRQEHWSGLPFPSPTTEPQPGSKYFNYPLGSPWSFL